jgi:hypothetical protein
MYLPGWKGRRCETTTTEAVQSWGKKRKKAWKYMGKQRTVVREEVPHYTIPMCNSIDASALYISNYTIQDQTTSFY